MKKGNFYFDRCHRIEAKYLIMLQVDSHQSSLHEKESLEQGFLSYILCEKSLISSIRIGLVRIASHRKTANITAFVAGMSPSIANNVPYLKPIVLSVMNFFNYPLFIHLCVQKQNRRKGIATQLLRQIEYEAQRQKFGSLVTDIKKENTVAGSFLLKQGFNVLPVKSITDRVFFYKDLAEKQP